MSESSSTNKQIKRRMHRQYTESARSAHVVAWKKSGLSRKAYSGQHNLTPSVFNRWCRAASLGKATTGFERIQIDSGHPASAPLLQGIEIVFPNGIYIRGVYPEDIALIGRLVRCI